MNYFIFIYRQYINNTCLFKYLSFKEFLLQYVREIFEYFYRLVIAVNYIENVFCESLRKLLSEKYINTTLSVPCTSRVA